MPSFYVRANLASAIWPFYTEAAGRTIIVPQSDENFDRYNAANTVPDKGVPQVFYMHNTLPISGGYQSIGYIKQVAAMAGAPNDFDQAFNLRSPNLSTHILVPASGKNYIYTGNHPTWRSINPLPVGAVKQGVTVTTAYVQGQTYFCYANYGTFYYDPAADAIVRVVWLAGALNDANVVSICASNGYLIAFSDKTVAWSSLTNPLDFTPSIQTGAGGGNVSDAKGAIHFGLSINQGFLVYCDKNVVGATYTGNTAYPFIFAEVPNSGGCNDPNRIAWQSNIDTHLAYTTSGIQLFSKSQATGIMPELADFLASQLYEDYNETTDVFTVTYLGNPVFVKISAVGDRYLVISYGPDSSNFTYAIVLDTVLNRYGKLKITHRSCFDFNNPSPNGAITYQNLLDAGITVAALAASNTIYSDFYTGSALQLQSVPKKTLSFLQQDGTLQIVDFELSEINAVGVFILGKFQHIRSNVIVHQRTDVESRGVNTNFTVSVLLTLDGKTLQPPLPTVVNNLGAQTGTYARRATGTNFSVLFKGAYNLTTVIINYTIGGSR